MKIFKIHEYINTLGNLRRAICAVNFICWAIATATGLQLVDSANEALIRFFLGPIGGAILTYMAKRTQYRSMPIKLNIEEKISCEPMTYAPLILPLFLTSFFLLAVFLGIKDLILWIPIAFLVNVGNQYAFFNVFGKS